MEGAISARNRRFDLAGGRGTGYLAGPMDHAVTPPSTGPLPAYRAMVAHGDLAPDTSQAGAAARLHTMWETLRGYAPKPMEPAGGGLLAILAPDSLPSCLFVNSACNMC